MRRVISFVFTLGAIALSSAQAAEAATEKLSWSQDFKAPIRWYIDNEVHLPQFMWFVSNRNKQVRVLAYQTTLVADCASAIPAGRKAFEVRCQIEDVSIRAASSRSERNRLNPILEEMTQKLKGARVDLKMKTNGRLIWLGLQEINLGEINRRTNQMRENLRLILHRAFAGLDLELPRKGTTEEGYWIQFDSALMMAPTNDGTRGAAEIIHRVEKVEDQLVTIQTSGDGTLTPGESGRNYYAAKIESSGVFDRDSGALVERSWMCAGQPTASSALAQGGVGLPYIQRGVLKRLSPDAVVSVGQSGEALPNEKSPGLIGTWGTIGAPAGDFRQ